MNNEYPKAESVSDAKRLSLQLKGIVQAPDGDLYLDGVRIKHRKDKETVNTLPPWQVITRSVFMYVYEPVSMAVAISLACGRPTESFEVRAAIASCWKDIIDMECDPYTEVCAPYIFGANKYTERGWETAYIPESECGQAARRHLSLSITETRDSESNALHKACAIFHFAAVLFYRELKSNDQ